MNIESQPMLEDLLYELLPVLGFAMSASSLLIIVVMRKSCGAFRFTVWFAINERLIEDKRSAALQRKI
ncbi:hypothetical protein ANCCAN_29543 [Ancylostoma caninum]|uniref:Uncharacterized protein n=1 Tax=Ancylostoma caninum TaxID=29170 RepID=A0A368EY67_ANCCA|nr:hypothetical protein ANCCAN_29543 [Ancylostoma caninum]